MQDDRGVAHGGGARGQGHQGASVATGAGSCGGHGGSKCSGRVGVGPLLVPSARKEPRARGLRWLTDSGRPVVGGLFRHGEPPLTGGAGAAVGYQCERGASPWVIDCERVETLIVCLAIDENTSIAGSRFEPRTPSANILTRSLLRWSRPRIRPIYEVAAVIDASKPRTRSSTAWSTRFDDCYEPRRKLSTARNTRILSKAARHVMPVSAEKRWASDRDARPTSGG